MSQKLCELELGPPPYSMAAAESELVSGNGWISDESSFYGEDEVKESLENRAQKVDISSYWNIHPHLPATLAFSTRSTSNVVSESKQKGPLRYPGEGQSSFRQSRESVDEFINRLPPSMSTASDVGGPWIWVLNPYDKTLGEEDKTDMTGFMQQASELLEQYNTDKRKVEDEMKGKPKGTITRKLRPRQEQLDRDLKQAATYHRYNTGKWMLFPPLEFVDDVWKKVAEATWQGQLGSSAKIAVREEGNERPPVLCVYTDEFQNVEDVKRVLDVLVRLNVVKKNDSRGIWYKCDAYTSLGIYSTNDYGLKASMYASRDMLRD